jgi:hypothetical protein
MSEARGNRIEATIAAWLRERALPGETLGSWAVLGYAKAPDQPNRSPMEAYVAAARLDPAAQRLPAHPTCFVALTDRRLLFGGQGGMLRFKAKALLLDVPGDDVRLEWWDQARPVADERHLLFRFRDGTWVRHSAMVHPRRNVAHFVDALGSRAAGVTA